MNQGCHAVSISGMRVEVQAALTTATRFSTARMLGPTVLAEIWAYMINLGGL